MSYVQISTNASALAHALGDTRGKEIPFATALALTEVAFKVQRTQKTEMARAMELRNRFSQGGVQVNRAEKADWPATYAEVGIDEKRSYLLDHITGGKRQGGAHGRAILEDTRLRSSNGRVKGALRPKAMIERAMRAKRQAGLRKAFGGRGGTDKRLPFLFHSAKWGNEVLAQRTGDDRYPLRIVYAFRRGVEIKRDFEFDLIAERMLGLTYYQAFNKALRKAIAGGKGKAERRGSGSRGVEIDNGR